MNVIYIFKEKKLKKKNIKKRKKKFFAHIAQLGNSFIFIKQCLN